ncbi:hypothetical protein ACFODZ_02360 [Marinicella sediminis]|uniref:Uncharacterized protein n=1 Tax=Marinicella sediminis TaxID=1792834 RepID=A0ABV7J869_9GAMM|nr:hypothetical protein [Marinicella sediminis]
MEKQTQNTSDDTLKDPGQVREMGPAERLLRSFGPLAGGVLLDLVDLATFGPVGLYLGPVIGGLLGWWLARVYRFGITGQCVLITLTVVYCTLPGTGLVPLATIIFGLVRLAETHRVKRHHQED